MYTDLYHFSLLHEVCIIRGCTVETVVSMQLLDYTGTYKIQTAINTGYI